MYQDKNMPPCESVPVTLLDRMHHVSERPFRLLDLICLIWSIQTTTTTTTESQVSIPLGMDQQHTADDFSKVLAFYMFFQKLPFLLQKLNLRCKKSLVQKSKVIDMALYHPFATIWGRNQLRHDVGDDRLWGYGWLPIHITLGLLTQSTVSWCHSI